MRTEPTVTGQLPYDRVVEGTLGNGLRVRLLPEPTVPAISYYTVFRVGSRNERIGLTGISHLFEHMMFNGAARYGPREFDRVLESHGGYSNAYTSNDLTVYYEDFATEALEIVADLESDRMRSLRIDDEALAQEREVVKEERRLRTDNSIFGLMEEQLEAMVFLSHPYRWPVIGWMEDIERITRADCEAYFRTFYAPSNATIYAVGDLDPAATMALLERRYGDIPAGPPPAPVPTGEPQQRGERRASIRFPAQGPAVLIGWRAPAGRHPDAAALDVLQVCLAAGEASRLRRRLIQQDEAAVSVTISWGWRIDPGIFSCFLEIPPGKDPAKAERILYEEIDRVASRGVTAKELARAQALLRSAVLHELATHHGLAHALAQAEALVGDWREAGRALARYAEIGAADVKRVAAAYLTSTSRSVVTLVPERTR
jgi:predicted Zn-dependent peptidase